MRDSATGLSPDDTGPVTAADAAERQRRKRDRDRERKRAESEANKAAYAADEAARNELRTLARTLPRPLTAQQARELAHERAQQAAPLAVDLWIGLLEDAGADMRERLEAARQVADRGGLRAGVEVSGAQGERPTISEGDLLAMVALARARATQAIDVTPIGVAPGTGPAGSGAARHAIPTGRAPADAPTPAPTGETTTPPSDDEGAGA